MSIIKPGEVADPVLREKLNSATRQFVDTGYQDYLVPGFAVRGGATAPDVENLRDGLYLPAFAGSGPTESGYFSVHILHDFKRDSTPTFHVHWTHDQASPSGDVKWQIEYSWARGYSVDAYPASTTLSAVQTAGAQYTHHITDDDDMALSESTLEPDGQLVCRIFRDSSDGADTFGNDAFLIGVDIHYEVGQFSTPERNRPWSGWS